MVKLCIKKLYICAVVTVLVMLMVGKHFTSNMPLTKMKIVLPDLKQRLGSGVAWLRNQRTKHSQKLILIWVPWRTHWQSPAHGEVFENGRCVVTHDQSQLQRADAVVFHYSKANIPSRWKYYRHPRQRFIWIGMEAPWSIRWLARLTLRHYDNFFNWTMSYKTNSDVYFPYGSSYVLWQKLARGKKAIDAIIAAKKGIAIWAVSQCSITTGATLRMNYFKKIQSVLPGIETYGLCFDRMVPVNYMKKLIVQKKFYFAFENSVHCKDYITEKFFDNALANGAVPVVWGTKKEDYLAVAPPDSFIHADDFESAEKLGEYLKYLDSNETAYRAYFHWRENETETWRDAQRAIEAKHPNIKTCKTDAHNPNQSYIRNGFDELCRKLLTDSNAQVIPSMADKIFGEVPQECYSMV